MLGLPVEIVTMLGSTVLGGFMKLWGMKQQARNDRDKALLAAASVNMQSVNAARDSAKGNGGMQWTRRIIAVSCIMAIIVVPKLFMFLHPETAISFGWTEMSGGFMFFTDSKEVFKWMTVSGIVITPLDTHTVSAIIGLYFGGSLVGHNK